MGKKSYAHPATLDSLFWTIAFVLVLILFAILKHPLLDTPFFWDELGVYGSMSFQLADKGPSMHPKALDQWLTHGHPLLYPFVISLWCKWFGTSVFNAHLCNLLISIVLVVSVFFHVSFLKNTLVGFMTIVLLIVQPIFFAQSAMVLPEIALSLALWWCTWTYFRKQIILYVLAGSAAVLIKEPAIVWIIGMFLYDFALGTPRYSLRSLRWLLPFVSFGIFLVIQKNTWGWYLYPSHMNGFDLTLDVVISKLRRYLLFLLWDQGRALLTLTIVVSIFITVSKPGLLNYFWPEKRTSFFSRGAMACLSYLLFCSLTFHLYRYVLPLFPFLCFLVAASVYRLLRARHWYLSILLFLGSTVLPATRMTSDHFVYDIDMSYIRAVNIEKKALQFMIDHGMYKEGKFSVNMPLIYAIGDKRFGYLPDSVPAYGSNQISESTAFAIALTPGSSLENPKNLPLELFFETYFHDIKMSVYKVVHDTIGHSK